MSGMSLDQILELPATERVEIAQQIWESVYEHPEAIPLTKAQKDELERRWRAFEQNPDEGESWDDVKRSLLGAGPRRRVFNHCTLTSGLHVFPVDQKRSDLAGR